MEGSIDLFSRNSKSKMLFTKSHSCLLLFMMIVNIYVWIQIWDKEIVEVVKSQNIPCLEPTVGSRHGIFWLFTTSTISLSQICIRTQIFIIIMNNNK